MIDNTTWFYKTLDFPELPEHLKQQFDLLLEQGLSSVPDTIHTKGQLDDTGYINYLKIRKTCLPNQKYVPGGEMIYKELTSEFSNWINSTLGENMLRPRFAIHKNDASNPFTFLAAHCDMIRNYGLNYLHRTGGSKVKTVWFQEEGHPVIRGAGVVDYTNPLVKIAEILIPANTWHIIRTDIIHHVEFMTSPRIRITADLTQEHVDAFESHVIDTLK